MLRLWLPVNTIGTILTMEHCIQNGHNGHLSCDEKSQGSKNSSGLSSPSKDTEAHHQSSSSAGAISHDQRYLHLDSMKSSYRTLLASVGEDPDREGLLDTPKRAAKAFLWFTKGYEETAKDIIGGAIFNENHKDMVIVRNINIFSLCEHHLVPFYGTCSIGYLPNNKIVGISKLARVVEVFSRRLQVQERLTNQIAEAIMEELEAVGVAVVINCSHMCMVMRGVEKPGSSTITTCMLGQFRDDPSTRDQFFTLTKI